ncbi:MAG: N-acetyllactosaminide 3-alpha-galactosyltransferase [Parcubacteria bacterium C7867-007]|nr:MAG: N-acetyllactosaminide 3-alpha-galactosyltransferase [Parcubacteria bacterium C7867-007]
MRLCIATPLYPPEPGGPATYARTLELGLPERDIHVSLVKFSEVRHMPKVIRHIAYYLRVLKAAKKADVILALDPASVGVPAAFAALVLNKPLVVKIVGDFAWEQGVQRFGIKQQLDAFVRTKNIPLAVAGLRAAQSFVAHQARTIIVPSQYLKKIVVAWGIPAEKIHVVYNALSLDEEIQETTLPPHSIVSVARLVPWKGMKGLVDALTIVRSSIPDASLVLIGDGPQRAELEAYASSDSVQFLGALSHAETLSYMSAADVFVLNSEYEGLSHVLIEALLLGKPIVASDAGGNPELITNEKTGLVIRTGDTNALAEAIIRILMDKAFAKQLAEEALTVQKRFSLDAMLSGTIQALSHV